CRAGSSRRVPRSRSSSRTRLAAPSPPGSQPRRTTADLDRPPTTGGRGCRGGPRSGLGPLVGGRSQDVLVVDDAAAHIAEQLRGWAAGLDRNDFRHRPAVVGDHELLPGLLYLAEILEHFRLEEALRYRGHAGILTMVMTLVKQNFSRLYT